MFSLSLFVQVGGASKRNNILTTLQKFSINLQQFLPLNKITAVNNYQTGLSGPLFPNESAMGQNPWDS